MNAIAIVVVALLWTLSGVLALAETAFTRANRIRLLALEEEGDKRARRVLRLLEHPEQTLNSILLLVLGCQSKRKPFWVVCQASPPPAQGPSQHGLTRLQPPDGQT